MSRVTLTSPFGRGTLTVADDAAAEVYLAAGWVREKATRRSPAKNKGTADDSGDSDSGN